MDRVQYYKDRFSSRTDEQLKDIIADTTGDNDIDAITAAIQLLKSRQPELPIPLKDIPKASREQLKYIIDHPKEWGENAVDIAKRTLLRLDHKPVGDVNPMSTSTKTFSATMIVLAILGAIPVLLFILFIFFIMASGIT